MEVEHSYQIRDIVATNRVVTHGLIRSYYRQLDYREANGVHLTATTLKKSLVYRQGVEWSSCMMDIKNIVTRHGSKHKLHC